MRRFLFAAACAAFASPVLAQTPDVGVVKPVFETRTLPDNADESDGDDPAVWIAPGDKAKSLVITAVKDGGMRVYDLKAKRKQVISPAPDGGRINNVDVAYGLALNDGRKVDVAVASDRGLDVIRIFRIDGGDEPLVEITAKGAGRAFPERPKANGDGLEANPLDDQNTAYGLTTWNRRGGGEVLAVVTQRGKARVGLFRLVPRGKGTVEAVYAYDFRTPVTHDGQDLRTENENDPLKDWSPQFEGLAVDQRNGVLYAGQEDVGVWRYPLAKGEGAEPRLVYETRGSAKSSFDNRDSVISRDVEGLCIYYGEDDQGYLIASSQGGAHGDQPAPDAPYDDSFAVFKLAGAKDPSLVGSFRVGKTKGIDATQESDGAEVISFGLPGFEKGVFITQDGYDGDELDGDPEASNFKFVRWEDIASSFSPKLTIAPKAYNPRTGE